MAPLSHGLLVSDARTAIKYNTQFAHCVRCVRAERMDMETHHETHMHELLNEHVNEPDHAPTRQLRCVRSCTPSSLTAH
jgi:hypothetical protein